MALAVKLREELSLSVIGARYVNAINKVLTQPQVAILDSTIQAKRKRQADVAQYQRDEPLRIRESLRRAAERKRELERKKQQERQKKRKVNRP